MFEWQLYTGNAAGGSRPHWRLLLNGEIHQDGSVLLNDPTVLAVYEARLIWPHERISWVLSFGTGRNPNKSLSGGGLELLKADYMGDATQETFSSWKTEFLRILDSTTDTIHNFHIDNNAYHYKSSCSMEAMINSSSISKTYMIWPWELIWVATMENIIIAKMASVPTTCPQLI